MSTIHIAVVSTRPTAALVRATVRRAVPAIPGATVHVLDLDGTYRAVGAEQVIMPGDVGLDEPDLHRRAARTEPADLVRGVAPDLVRAVLAHAPVPADATVLALRPGVLLLGWPSAVLDAAARHGVALVVRAPVALPSDDRWPTTADLLRCGSYASSLVAVHGPADEVLELWSRAGADGDSDRWLDLAASRLSPGVLREPAVLLSAWNLTASHRVEPAPGVEVDALLLDGAPVQALDLSGWDPARPWLLDAAALGDPRARLSDHPALARVVHHVGVDLARDAEALPGLQDGRWDLMTTSLGLPVDAPLRELYRAAEAALGGAAPPDPFEPAEADDLRTWLTEPAPDGGPGRYLLAIHRTRPDLRAAYPAVPGAGTAGFLAWAGTHGRTEQYPAELVDAALAGLATSPKGRPGRPARGVNVVGYLRGELGIGESARLLVSALRAAGVPHAPVAVDRHLTSRQRTAEPDQAPPERHFDTTILCVNADLTPAVAADVPQVLDRSYRIGMWYWEVEDFPASQHGGFAAVDEVWVATEFVRSAIEPHSPVPVRTLTPPLPQRGTEPALTRADLGLPPGYLFLFSFDYLSTAERKNPLGLLEAFSRAFPPGEGPVLVLKSINAARRPAEAERLRLAAAQRPDVVLLEQYLDPAERDALVALCDCYVSLHRSEGLGLTMAEAMAWGKPVIATAYSGNLEFMTPENSFLVPWTPAVIPPDAAPYPAGGVWAEPDLDEAARLLRLVVERPDVAAERGARAAQDIATLHSPEAAGRRIAARLAETASRRRARSRSTVAARLRSAARQTRDALG